MRTPDRDRCRFALAALCIASLTALVLVAPAGALNASYEVLPNGTSYAISMNITGVSQYMFADTGVMGENVPITVTNVTLINENGTPAGYNRTDRWSAPTLITFPKGNYTISYIAPLHDNHIQGEFPAPYNITVTLPENYSVQNPLLAGISLGANVTRFPDNTTLLSWNKTTSFDLRFYDQGRENLLYMFGNFWILFALILLIPFLLMRSPPQE